MPNGILLCLTSDPVSCIGPISFIQMPSRIEGCQYRIRKQWYLFGINHNFFVLSTFSCTVDEMWAIYIFFSFFVIYQEIVGFKTSWKKYTILSEMGKALTTAF